MSAIVFAALLLVRIILPLSILITVGEWVHRRESNYWLHK